MIKPPRRICIIGWPVEHSRSPLIHNYWIKHHAIENAVYERLSVPPEDAGRTIRDLSALGFWGANVTVPHKETAFRTLARCDASASRLKAVNTIVSSDGELEGRNTDGYGFLANLQGSNSSQTLDQRIEAGPAVLLGAGGAARAIAAALEDAGAPLIRIVNRTRAKAEALVADLGLRHAEIHDWASYARALSGATLLVNTTTLGMQGQPPLDIALDGLSPAALVTDIVYTPLCTLFLENARAHGAATVDGLGMLLHQAVPGFEAWFGIRPEVTLELRALVLQDLGDPASCS